MMKPIALIFLSSLFASSISCVTPSADRRVRHEQYESAETTRTVGLVVLGVLGGGGSVAAGVVGATTGAGDCFCPASSAATMLTGIGALTGMLIGTTITVIGASNMGTIEEYDATLSAPERLNLVR